MKNTQMPTPDSPKLFSTISGYFRKYRGYLIAGSIAVLATNILLLYTPYLTKIIFDRLEAKAPSGEILKYVLLIIGLTLVAGIFRFLMRRTIIWMSRYIEYDLRCDIMSHLLKLSPSFYHRTRTGDIMARMTNDLEAVRQMIGPGVMYISDSFVKLVISFSVMIYLSAELTLYVTIPMLILPLAVNLVGNMLYRRSMRIQEHFSLLTNTAQENLAGIRVVKAYGQEEFELENFATQSLKYIELNMSLARLQGVFFPLMRLIASFSYLAVFFMGGLAIIDGSISLGTVVAFFAYVSVITWPVIALGWVLSLYQRGSASLKRINNILHSQPDIDNVSGGGHAVPMKGKIEFKNLTFGYNGANVLDGINLTIEPGQTVGLIGLTGSGKTTLVSLLPRLYPVERGQLLIDGVDINDWAIHSLRRQIGFATQEPFLFSDTVGNNILFGTDDHDREIMAAAADTAALTKDVEDFPDRWDTLVGERGITLSGGQKQRTAIARAIVVDPAILILDDATSAVDTETEHEINERIKKVLTGRTSIIISHRVSAVKDADTILYLHGGRIVEQGAHEALMQLDGRYAQLYRSQLLALELDQL